MKTPNARNKCLIAFQTDTPRLSAQTVGGDQRRACGSE